jgi:hypothetical protein
VCANLRKATVFGVNNWWNPTPDRGFSDDGADGECFFGANYNCVGLWFNL